MTRGQWLGPNTRKRLAGSLLVKLSIEDSGYKTLEVRMPKNQFSVGKRGNSRLSDTTRELRDNTLLVGYGNLSFQRSLEKSKVRLKRGIGVWFLKTNGSLNCKIMRRAGMVKVMNRNFS